MQTNIYIIITRNYTDIVSYTKFTYLKNTSPWYIPC